MKNTMLRFLLGALLLLTGGLGQAQISQVPLIVGGASVPPNLVFTFDDSGSMFFECLPEALCIGSKYVGTMPGGTATFKNGVATYDLNTLFNRQMRSAATNVQYYNPTIRYSPWLKSDGSSYPTYPATAAPVDPRVPATVINLVVTSTFTTTFCTGPSACGGSVSAQSVYPAQYFSLISGTGTALANFTRTMIVGALSTYPKTADRTDCALLVCSLAEEQQNFANWFTYYRNKLVAAIGGTATAFYNLPVTYRLGYGRINKDDNSAVDGVNTNTIVRGLRPFTGADRDSFYTWLFTLQPDDGGTPLRRAMGDVGEYYTRADNRGPWSNTPGTTDTSAHLTCRRSFHLLMTDGSWNGAAASNSAAAGNVDGTNGTAVTGPNGLSYTYTRGYPYRDATGGTLADVAMYYWLKDLRSDLLNEVKPNAGDPAFWQHMVNYTIGFGVNGKLNNPGDLAALTANTKSWGDPTSDADNKVDDLWHAAVNSRGLSLSAADPQEYAAALRAVITNIDERNGSDAGVAVSGRFLTSASRKYVPEYRTNSWVGELSAISLDSDGNDGAIIWRASDRIPAAANRNIFTYKDSATGAVTFTWAGLTAQGMTSTLNVTAAEGPGLVNYLRGDPTGEGSTYRARSKRLGDIVNSSPTLVKDSLNQGYDFLPSGPDGTATRAAATAYRQFLVNKKYRIGQVYVGANDGMMHVFSDVNGTETFAFMPKSILGKVKKLSVEPYDHEYFVDGPTVEADVYDNSLGTSGAWRSIVVSGSGAGAKNLFAINTPVPSTPATTGTRTLTLLPPGPSDVLWEVSNSSLDYAELGYNLAGAEVGIMRDGQWAVIVGNGYESLSGRAQLFIINALTGALIKRIDTGIPVIPVVGSPNGLGGVRVYRDSQRRIVSAYAGDLRGNLWKFDLSGTTPASWGVAFGSTAALPKPFFQAINRNNQAEPITAAPAITPHFNGGVMVLASTGKLFETGDINNTQERTLYGLWDKVIPGNSSAAATGAITSTVTLVLQQISATLTVSIGSPAQTVTFYSATANPVDYTTKRGWRFPLTIQAGQRGIYDPQVVAGRVFIETVVPGAVVQTCQASSGVGYNFVLDPFTGSAGAGRTLDTNGDGIIDGNDNPNAIIYVAGADGGDAIISQGGGNAGSNIPSSGDGAGGTGTGSGGTGSGGSVINGSGKQGFTFGEDTGGANGGNSFGDSQTAGQNQLALSPGRSVIFGGSPLRIRRNWRHILTPP